MIIVRCPLRISLGGGGTDLASYYKKREGFLVAGTINKYIYIAIHKTFDSQIIAKYSSVEKVNTFSEISHPIIKEVLKKYLPEINSIEITSFADIPSGTGLGSSSAFTNALIKGIHSFKMDQIDNQVLAEESCDIEINKLKEPIGKQDQYITALGGIRAFTFRKDESVNHSLVLDSENDYSLFSSNLVLVFTGKTRRASTLLKDQKDKSENNNEQMLKNLDDTKKLGKKSLHAIRSKNFDEFGSIMHEHWLNKKRRSKGMTDDHIDEIYKFGLSHGANGGKVIGAGGGGFLLFQTSERNKLVNQLSRRGYRIVDFNFVPSGCEIINLS